MFSIPRQVSCDPEMAKTWFLSYSSRVIPSPVVYNAALVSLNSPPVKSLFRMIDQPAHPRRLVILILVRRGLTHRW